MLHRDRRLRSSADFAMVTRAGLRTRRGDLMLYFLAADRTRSSVPSTAGLIVGKAVGNSVVRHRVSRRLREQLRIELDNVGAGDRIVVRALPGAGAASSGSLASDLRAAVRKLAYRRPTP